MRALPVILVLCSSSAWSGPLQPALEPVQLNALVGLKFRWGYVTNNAVVRTRSWGDLTIPVRTRGAGIVGLVIKDGDRHDIAWQGMWKAGGFVAVIENDRSDSTTCLETNTECQAADFIAIVPVASDRTLHARVLATITRRAADKGVFYFDVPAPKDAPSTSEIQFAPGAEELARRLARRLYRVLGPLEPKPMAAAGSPYRVQVFVGSAAMPPTGKRSGAIVRGLVPATDEMITALILKTQMIVAGCSCTFAADTTFTCNDKRVSGVWTVSDGVVNLRAGEDREFGFRKNGRASIRIEQMAPDGTIQREGSPYLLRCNGSCSSSGEAPWGLRAGPADQSAIEEVIVNRRFIELEGEATGTEPSLTCAYCGSSVASDVADLFGITQCVTGAVPRNLACVLEVPAEKAAPAPPPTPTRVKLIDGACVKPPCSSAVFERVAKQLGDPAKYSLEKAPPAKNVRAATEVWSSPGKKALADAVARELFGAAAPESKEWTFGGAQDVVIITGP